MSIIPKGQLTAYERWELAAFDAPADEPASAAAEPAAAPAEAPAPDGAPSSADATTVTEAEPSPAEALVLPTAADVERIHNEAYEQGYAAGVEEGAAAGQASAARMAELLGQLQSAVDAIDQHIADRLLDTAVEIAAQVVRQSLRIKPELLLPVVREAIHALRTDDASTLVLLAHPDDAALIRKHMGEQLTRSNWQIVDDDTLTPGGCKVELGIAEVDATLQTRWKRTIEAIGVRRDWLDDPN